MKFLKTYLLLLFYLSSLNAQPNPIDFYSKKKVEKLRYYYLKSSGHFLDRKEIKFWIEDLFISTIDPLVKIEVQVKDKQAGGQEVKGSCNGISLPIECAINMEQQVNEGKFKDGTFEIIVATKTSNFVALSFPYTNYKFVYYINSCDAENNNACVCDKNMYATVDCKESVPSPCHNLYTHDLGPPDLSIYSKPAFKIDFKETFDKSNFGAKDLYVYDDMFFKYYSLHYEPVPKSVDAKPYGNKFRMRLRIAETAEEINPRKENFMVANFEVNEIMDFRNAFCEKTGEKSITCVCCEYSEVDQFCKTSHSDNEVQIHESIEVKNVGFFVINNAKAWTSRDKKRFYVQFFDALETFYQASSLYFRLTFINSGETSMAKAVRCEQSQRDKECYFPIDEKVKENGEARFEVCTSTCYILFSLKVENYAIKIEPNEDIKCQIFTFSGANQKEKYCICPIDVDDISSVKTSSGLTCLPYTTTCPQSGNQAFSMTIDIEKSEKLRLDGGIVVFTNDAPSSTDGYALKFEPTSSLSPKKQPKAGWSIKIWVVKFNEIPRTSNSIKLFYPLFDGVHKFENAFCQEESRMNRDISIGCTCCDEMLGNCDPVDEYEFHFAQNVPNTGFIIGSGVAWSNTQKLNIRLDDVYLGRNLRGRFKMTPEYSGSCPLYGYKNKACSQRINGNTFQIIIERDSIEVMVFTLEDFKIKVNSPNGCDVDNKVKTKGIFCTCKSGERTDQNCPIGNMMHQCNSDVSQPNYEPPKMIFSSVDFRMPTNYVGYYSQLIFTTNTEPEKVYRLTYEPIQEMAKKHPDDDPVFLMSMSLGEFAGRYFRKTNSVINFQTNPNQLWIFNQAYCQINSRNVECTCCEGYQGNTEQICLNAQITSGMSIKFSIVIPNYGYMLADFQLTLNSRSYFTLKGNGATLIKEFVHKFRLNFVKNEDQSDIQYCEWPECLFKFKTLLKNGDKLKLGLEMLVENKPINSNSIDTLTLGEGNTIKPEGNENGCYLYTNHDKYTHSCSCPNNIDFNNDICNHMNPLQCQKIEQINKMEIKNKTRKFASFYLKMGDPGENNPTIVYNKNKKEYYTFSYKVTDSTKQVYKISIGPTKATSQLSATSSIVTNFNFSLSLIQFNDVSCSFHNNEWFCECCSGVECDYKDPKIYPSPLKSQTTTPKPDSKIPTLSPVKPKEDKCKNRPKNEETTKLCDIDKYEKIDFSTMDNVTKETKQALNPQKTTAEDIAIAGDIISKLANIKNATTEQRKSTIELFDHILESKEESFKENGRETSDGYLNSMDKILAESKEDISYLNGSNLGAEKKKLSCEDNESWTGILDDSQKFKVENGGIGPGDGIASIELNKENLCKNSAGNLMQSIYFVIYRNGKLFQADDKEEGETDNKDNEDIKSSSNSKQKNRCKKGYDPTNGFILSSVVSNKNAPINARLRFKKEDFKLPPHSNLAVTWWDKTEWSENRQCTFKLEGNEYVAHCDHLTNFALLVEKSSTDPLLCDTVLDKLGFWLCILSLVALFILALIYLTRLIPIVKDSALISIVNNQRRSGADTLIIVYVLIMLMFYFFFTIFIDQSMTNSKVFCKITAAFLYFLFLSAMFLNLFQAWDMIKMCSWNSQMENILQMITRIYVVLPVSFGLPFLIVIIVFFADGTFFFRDDQFCWIRPQSIIFAVLIPVTLMLLNSFVAFAIFCVRMFPDFFKRFGIKGSSVQLAKGEKQARRMNLELFIALLFAQFILGFPWILQYPAMFSSGATAWHYLFAIFNGTNGIILFLIYFYGRAMAFYRLRKGNNSAGNTRSTNVNSGQENNGKDFEGEERERRDSVGSEESNGPEDSF